MSGNHLIVPSEFRLKRNMRYSYPAVGDGFPSTHDDLRPHTKIFAHIRRFASTHEGYRTFFSSLQSHMYPI